MYAEAIKRGDDPVAVVRRLLRAKWDKHGAFMIPSLTPSSIIDAPARNIALHRPRKRPLCRFCARPRPLPALKSCDADEKSLGLFDTRHRAVSAVREFKSDANR